MRRRAVVALAAAAALAGCASLGAPRPPDTIAGRLALSVAGAEPKSLTADFELRGGAERGTLSLATPIGTTLAEARWSPGAVELLTSDGARRFDDLESLSREALGESLPLAALFDWLRGRPWDGAPSRPRDGGAGFTQLGWNVDLAQFADGRLVARRDAAPAGVLLVRLEPRA